MGLELVAIFVVPGGLRAPSLTLGQSIARSGFQHEFVEVARSSPATGLPMGHEFRIGPDTYNKACMSDDDVLVWADSDDFFTSSAV